MATDFPYSYDSKLNSTATQCRSYGACLILENTRSLGDGLIHLASLRRWEPGATEPHCSKERGFAVLLGQEWVSADLERLVKALSCPLVPKHLLSLGMRMAVG